MKPFLNITKALADETRLRILMALRDDELCVCQLISLLGMAPSTVSRHLYLLEQAGLVEKRKAGKWNFCRLAGPSAPPPVRGALRLVREALAASPRIARDAERLAAITSMSLEEVCLPLNDKRKRKARR